MPSSLYLIKITFTIEIKKTLKYCNMQQTTSLRNESNAFWILSTSFGNIKSGCENPLALGFCINIRFCIRIIFRI